MTAEFAPEDPKKEFTIEYNDAAIAFKYSPLFTPGIEHIQYSVEYLVQADSPYYMYIMEENSDKRLLDSRQGVNASTVIRTKFTRIWLGPKE